MQSFSIHEPNIKDFMQHLFAHDTFVNLEVRGVVVHSFTYFEISGQQQDETFCTWNELRPYVRNIIKGDKKPRAMKIIFAQGNPESLHPNAATLFINFLYETSDTEGDKITLTTACSQKSFELSKAVDQEWDRWVTSFLKENGILFSLLQQP